MRRAAGISPQWQQAMLLKEYRQLSPYSRPWYGAYMKRELMRCKPLLWKRTLRLMRLSP